MLILGNANAKQCNLSNANAKQYNGKQCYC